MVRFAIPKMRVLTSLLCVQLAFAPMLALAQTPTASPAGEQETVPLTEATSTTETPTDANEYDIPLLPMQVGDYVMPSYTFSYHITYPGAPDAVYSETDILVSSPAETGAVLKLAGQLARTASHTTITYYVPAGAGGQKQIRDFYNLVPKTMNASFYGVGLSPSLMARQSARDKTINGKVYRTFDAMRARFLRANYHRFVRWGKTGKGLKWMAIGRLTGNFSGALLSVFNAPASWVGKVGFGLVTGGLSWGFMVLNPKLRNWLTNHRSLPKLYSGYQSVMAKLGVRFIDKIAANDSNFNTWSRIAAPVSPGTINESSALAKWGGTELLFLALQASERAAADMPMATTAGGYVGVGASTLISAIGAQYPWEKGHADLWAKYVNHIQDENDRLFFGTYSDFKIMLDSVAATTAATIALGSHALGISLLVAMGIMGYRYRQVVGQTSPETLRKKFTCAGILGESSTPLKAATQSLQFAPGVVVQSHVYGNGSMRATFRFVNN